MLQALHCGFFHLTLKVEPRDGKDPVLNLARIAFTGIKESPGEITMLTASAGVLSHLLFIPDGGGRGLIQVTTSTGLSLPWLDFKVPCLVILDLEYAPLRPPSPHPSMSGERYLEVF